MLKSKLRDEILELDHHKCRIWGCGNTFPLEVHHIIPISCEGVDKPWNLITVCTHCHIKATADKNFLLYTLERLRKNPQEYRWGKAHDQLLVMKHLREMIRS